MDYEQITYEKVGGVARVTLNRPQYYNAQSRRLRDEMDAAFGGAVSDDEVRVIILAGAGRHFSSGHDMGTPEDVADRARRPKNPDETLERVRAVWQYNVDNSLRWRALPKPTIAQVQGYCIFGGWIIASAMDLIVAADDAMFLPGFVQYFGVPWEIGVRKAKEILFQSRFIDAEEAMRLGFVNKVVPRAQLEQATLELASSIAESDPLMLRVMKQALNQAQDAMGFRAAVESAFNGYMLLELAGRYSPREGGPRRLPPVDQALRKLRRREPST